MNVACVVASLRSSWSSCCGPHCTHAQVFAWAGPHAPSFPTSTPTADAGAGSKAATLSSGAIVQVPSFLDVGTKVKVDTRTGSYLVSAGAGVAGLVLRSMRGRAQPQLSVKAAHDCACHQPQHCPHHLHPLPPNRLQSKAN